MESLCKNGVDCGELELQRLGFIPGGYKVFSNYDTRPGKECKSIEEYTTMLSNLGNDVLISGIAFSYQGKRLPNHYVTILTKPKRQEEN